MFFFFHLLYPFPIADTYTSMSAATPIYFPFFLNNTTTSKKKKNEREKKKKEKRIADLNSDLVPIRTTELPVPFGLQSSSFFFFLDAKGLPHYIFLSRFSSCPSVLLCLVLSFISTSRRFLCCLRPSVFLSTICRIGWFPLLLLLLSALYGMTTCPVLSHQHRFHTHRQI